MDCGRVGVSGMPFCPTVSHLRRERSRSTSDGAGITARHEVQPRGVAFGAEAADFGQNGPVAKGFHEHWRVAVTIPCAILVWILREHLGRLRISSGPKGLWGRPLPYPARPAGRRELRREQDVQRTSLFHPRGFALLSRLRPSSCPYDASRSLDARRCYLKPDFLPPDRPYWRAREAGEV